MIITIDVGSDELVLNLLKLLGLTKTPDVNVYAPHQCAPLDIEKIRQTIDEAIRNNLPTEQKFRETVEAMVTMASATTPAPKIEVSRRANRKRRKPPRA